MKVIDAEECRSALLSQNGGSIDQEVTETTCDCEMARISMDCLADSNGTCAKKQSRNST